MQSTTPPQFVPGGRRFRLIVPFSILPGRPTRLGFPWLARNTSQLRMNAPYTRSPTPSEGPRCASSPPLKDFTSQLSCSYSSPSSNTDGASNEQIDYGNRTIKEEGGSSEVSLQIPFPFRTLPLIDNNASPRMKSTIPCELTLNTTRLPR